MQYNNLQILLLNAGVQLPVPVELESRGGGGPRGPRLQTGPGGSTEQQRPHTCSWTALYVHELHLTKIYYSTNLGNGRNIAGRGYRKC
jgi:hypothetical protein